MLLMGDYVQSQYWPSTLLQTLRARWLEAANFARMMSLIQDPLGVIRGKDYMYRTRPDGSQQPSAHNLCPTTRPENADKGTS